MSFQKISLKKLQRRRRLGKIKKETIAFLGNFYSKIKSKIQGKKRKSHVAILVIGLMIIFSSMLVYQIAGGVYKFFQNNGVKEAVFKIAGTKLPIDENGFTNILILGIGGEGHDGGELTDSIIMASIDQKTKSIAMLSIPRDFYADTEVTSSRINEILRDAPKRYQKKGLSEEEAWQKSIELLENEIEEAIGIQAQAYAKIDFSGFEKLIDAIDGIDVFVDRTINDPEYPDGNWGYEHFFLSSGNQHLDGKTALKYARSRHDSSDFDRSQRQQNVLEAFRTKTLKMEILTSPEKLSNLYEVISENFETDLSFGELISLAEFASNFDKSRMISRVLTDDEYSMGGFLVTPDRELYGGAFVLVPFLNLYENKFDQIHAFSDFVFHERFLSFNSPHIKIENASSVSGLANSLRLHLERYGIPVDKIATAEERSAETIISYTNNERNQRTIEILGRLLEFKTQKIEIGELTEEEQVPDYILITIGQDYQQPFRFPLPKTGSAEPALE